MQANGNENTNLFTIEQITLLCGFIFLAEPLFSLLEYHVTRDAQVGDRRSPMATVAFVLEKLLLIAMFLGAYAGVKMSSLKNADGSTSSQLTTVENCRDANAILCCVITVLGAALLLYAATQEALPKFQTWYLLAVSIVLTIPSAYKIVLYEGSSPNPEHVGTKIAFCLSPTHSFPIQT